MSREYEENDDIKTIRQIIRSIFEDIDRSCKVNDLKYREPVRYSVKRGKGKINDHRRIRLEDEDYIPFKTGRPKREHPICKDDLINLSIALNRSRTLEEFIAKT